MPEDELLWRRVPGVSNPVGNLMLHLEGNLREYVGRQLGGIAYERKRDLEFRSTGLSRAELAPRLAALQQMVPEVLSGLSDAQLDAIYPENVLGVPLSTRMFLIHLQGHLNYHLGQIDYLRRVLTQASAIALAGL